jgi:hypothetical protein
MTDWLWWVICIDLCCFLGMLLTPITSLRTYLRQRKLTKLRGERHD